MLSIKENYLKSSKVMQIYLLADQQGLFTSRNIFRMEVLVFGGKLRRIFLEVNCTVILLTLSLF